MKNFRNYFMIVAVFGLLFTSCSKDENPMTEDQETATLTFGTDLQDIMKSMMAKQQDVGECVDGDPAFAQITLEYNGTEETVVVPILEDDNGFFTAYHDDLEIPVPAGNTHVSVTLTDFVVWTDDNNDGNPDEVLWVAPRVGSEYAQFVTNPIGGDASTWNLRAGSKTYTDIEVLCFDNRDVNRYGYQFFDIIPREVQNICFFANYCPDGPDGRDRVANYSLDLYHYTGTPEEDPNPAGTLYTSLSSNQSPGRGGWATEDYYADPVCLNIPVLAEGEYVYYEATLSPWEGNYATPETHVVSGYLSQADIVELIEADGDDNPDTMDYMHLFFNCGEDTVVEPGDCPPAPGADCNQIAYDGLELSISGLGLDENPTIPLVYNDVQVGTVIANLEADSDLILTFDMDAGYRVSAAEMWLHDYIAISDDETARQACVENLTNEDEFQLIFEDLLSPQLSGINIGQTLEDIYPILYDLTVNYCPDND